MGKCSKYLLKCSKLYPKRTITTPTIRYNQVFKTVRHREYQTVATHTDFDN